MTGLSAQAGVLVLADSDTGKGSPIGLFVVLVLVIAVYFLYRSMNRHLRKLPPSFDPPPADQLLADQKTLADQSDNPAAGVTEPPASPRGPEPDRL